MLKQLIVAACFIFTLQLIVACSTISEIPVSEQIGEYSINTTIDSEETRYFLEHYSQRQRLKPALDQKITAAFDDTKEWQSHEFLGELSQTFSPDFATLYLVHQLLSELISNSYTCRNTSCVSLFIEKSNLTMRITQI